MMHKKTSTYWAKIFIGTRVKYTGETFSVGRIEDICQKYVDKVGLCVTVTETKFIYTKGRESGAIVGLINYPRFPSDPLDIKDKAMALAKILKKEMGQLAVSVMLPNETIMLGREKEDV